MEKQAKFIELAKKYEKMKEDMDQVRTELEQVMNDLGHVYVQDPETMAVYKIVEPNGTFITFRKVDYKRTNVAGEKGGGGTVLSKKEAEEAGFTLSK